jgi:hypothetical protein
VSSLLELVQSVVAEALDVIEREDRSGNGGVTLCP